VRRGVIDRRTNETQIRLVIGLDGKGRYTVTTGIRFLDHMLELFARHGAFDLQLAATGDLDVDQHHTVEDVGIALGEAVSQALGDRRGINRAGYFVMPMDETLAVAAIDLSGRPHAVVDLRLKVRREAAQVHAARQELRPLLGRSPSQTEVAKATGLSEAAVRRVMPVGIAPVSLDADDRSVDVMLQDPGARVEEEVMAKARASAARVLLGALTPHQQRVVRLRFGLDDGEERNRAEVGRLLSVSRERVRQIELEAFERLRRAARVQGLGELVG